MKDETLFQGKFTREIRFLPAFDKRDPEPSKSYGIHGMEIYFYLKGPKGVVQHYGHTGMFLPHVAEELFEKQSTPSESRYNIFKNNGYDIGYHSPKPIYEGQTPMSSKCAMVPEGSPCYYDGSTLNAEPIWDDFISKGEDAVWDHMVEWYKNTFEKQDDSSKA